MPDFEKLEGKKKYVKGETDPTPPKPAKPTTNVSQDSPHKDIQFNLKSGNGIGGGKGKPVRFKDMGATTINIPKSVTESGKTPPTPSSGGGEVKGLTQFEYDLRKSGIKTAIESVKGAIKKTYVDNPKLFAESVKKTVQKGVDYFTKK